MASSPQSEGRHAHPEPVASSTMIRPAPFTARRATPPRPADPAPSPLLGVYLEDWLRHAERTGHVARYVARLALPPRVPRRAVHPLSPGRAGVLLAGMAGDRFGVLY